LGYLILVLAVAFHISDAFRDGAWISNSELELNLFSLELSVVLEESFYLDVIHANKLKSLISDNQIKRRLLDEILFLHS
jgi:hypothetical protein